MKTYYKVVRRDGERLVSAIMGWTYGGKLQRVYRRKRWTLGVKGTPVMAFDNLRAARQFVPDLPRSEIWEAEVREPRRLNRILRLGRVSSFLAFWGLLRDKQYWSRLPLDLDSLCPVDTPSGTVACEAIRLVRKI